MEKEIDVARLRQLLEAQSVQAVRAQYLDRLSADARDFLSRFEAFEGDLQTLGQVVQEAQPAAPDFQFPDKRELEARPKKGLYFPIWQFALGLLAAFGLGFLSRQAFWPVQGETQLEDHLALTRSGSTPGTPYDEDLVRLHLERGLFLFERDQYQGALQSLEMAHQLDSQNRETLTYLIRVCEAMGAAKLQQRYREALQELAENP